LPWDVGKLEFGFAFLVVVVVVVVAPLNCKGKSFCGVLFGLDFISCGRLLHTWVAFHNSSAATSTPTGLA